MKIIFVLLALVICASAKFNDKYVNYLKKFGKNVDRLPSEVQVRRQQNYLDNIAFIEKENKKNLGYKLGSNEHTDRHRERFI